MPIIGSTVSHYKILEKLGQGGMGVVYKAEDLKLKRTVALKFLPRDVLAGAAERARLLHEAQAVAALDHPNICAIHEIDDVDDQPFMVMAFVDGQTLHQKVLEGPLTETEAIDIARQVAQGLQAAHEKGIVHRDIKSPNIMITPSGQIKIMDFGLARVPERTQLTKAGMIPGTLSSMSPEQALGEILDHRSDIWSLGIVLYEMLTGNLPFTSAYDQAIIYRILNEKPRPLSGVRADVSPGLETIVNTCLEKAPADRFQDISELLAALYRLKGVAPPPEALWKPMRKNYRKFVGPAIAVATVVVGAAAYLLFMRHSTGLPKAGGSEISIAVVYFENIPDPEDKDHLSEMLTSLLITSFSQTKGIQVISRERLYHIQEELGFVESHTFTAHNASRVAQRAGVKSMLVGSILQAYPTLFVTTRLIDVESGNILSSQKIEGYAPNKFFTLVDSLSSLTLKDLKITPTEAGPVMSVTTNSPEAYRAYTEGVALERKFENALPPLTKAVELDSNFAMAYFAIAQSQELFGDQVMRRTSLEKAWKLRSKVTEREQMLIEGAYARTIEKDGFKGAAILERLVQKYPREQEAYYELSHIYWDLNDVEKAEKTLFRGMSNDSLDKTLWMNLAYFYTGWGRRREAFEAVDNYVRLAPGEYNPYDAKGDIYLIFGEADSALTWKKKVVSFDPTSARGLGLDAVLRQEYSKAQKYFEESGSTFLLFLIPLHQGHFKEARDQLMRARFPSSLDRLAWMRVLDYEIADYPSMLKDAREISIQLRRDPTNRLYGRDCLAWAYIKNGNRKLAYELLDELSEVSNDRSATWEEQCQYEYASALCAYEEQRYDAALEHFKKAFTHTFPNRFGQYFYGVTLLKTGHVSEAIDELRRSGWKYNIGWVSKGVLQFLPTRQYWLLATIKAHYWLGVAYEEEGEKDRAAREFEKFLDIWKTLDSESPELKDARVRLARLTGVAKK